MAYREQLAGYVKFLRGTPTAWESIQTKDPNTLYFIAEPNALSGKLYLGNKLISGGGGGSAVTLNDLQDVLMGENIPSNALLVYDETAQLWKPVSLATAIATVVEPMTGATAEEDGLAGLVPQPQAGEQGLFLRGSGVWANPTAEVESSLAALRGSDTTGTIREIAIDAVNDLLSNAPENLDTLQELVDWIAEHEEDFDFASDIHELNDAMFGTIEDPEESIADLVSMVQEDGVIRTLVNLQTIVLGNGQEGTGLEDRLSQVEEDIEDIAVDIAGLNDLVAAASDRLDAIESDLEDVDARLRWSDLVQDNENNGE
jgi:uncharacterized coiled-coil protein SlyX